MERHEEREPRIRRHAAAQPEEATTPMRDERSLGDLFRELAGETRQLVRQEIRLAKVEVSEIASEAGKNIGLAVAGGAVAYGGFLTILAALGFLLGSIMPVWLSFALVGLVVCIIGYAVYRSGMSGLQETDFSLERTTETLQEDKQWMRQEAQEVKDDPSRLGARR